MTHAPSDLRDEELTIQVLGLWSFAPPDPATGTPKVVATRIRHLELGSVHEGDPDA